MATPFKEAFSKRLVDGLSESLAKTDFNFNKSDFLDRVYRADWDELELKERMNRISESIHEALEKDYLRGLSSLEKISKKLLDSDIKTQGIEFLFIPDYIGRFGLNHFDESLRAMRMVTKLVSCEFAVRPFIAEDQHRSFREIYSWMEDEDENVRRLSSEGCRPRLPWGMQLKSLMEDPKPILPVLNHLRKDPSLYVRKSVANNINDISKDHPNLVLNLGKKWKGESADTDWIIKHGLRSLLKAGHGEALGLIGYANPNSIRTTNFKVKTPSVPLGRDLEFEFELLQTRKGDALHRIEYAIYFLLGNGKHYRKVFKISERSLDHEKTQPFQRKHSFRKITTRKYYPGAHFVSLIINGKEIEKKAFKLTQ